MQTAPPPKPLSERRMWISAIAGRFDPCNNGKCREWPKTRSTTALDPRKLVDNSSARRGTMTAIAGCRKCLNHIDLRHGRPARVATLTF